VEELLLSLDETAARLTLDFRDKAHRGGNAEVGLEKDLLQALQRALNGAPAGDYGDVGERDVLYLGPQRPFGYIPGLPDYPACHSVLIRFEGTKKPGP